MRKLSLITICSLIALLLASCQTGIKEDANGNTPTMIIDKMYQAIKANDYATAVSYNKLPDTIRINSENVFNEFKQKEKDGKIIIPRDEWESFLIEKMNIHSNGFTLDSWEIVSEDISKTDPNSAKVKTKIQITTPNGKSEAECSFPLKRENNVWMIIG